MSDHETECPKSDVRMIALYGDQCLCPALRACEQRVLLSKPNIELSAVYGYEAGRSDGLNAARDAVAAAKAVDVSAGHLLDESRYFVWMHEALAAIDALRGDA